MVEFDIKRNVALGDGGYEPHVWVTEEYVKVLHSMNRLERSPVLEPNNLFSVD